MSTYDDLPYRAFPIEWSAPERLALTSILHGGPRRSLYGYRVLELGCANGANLLPMAWYRRHSSFVGVDGSQRQIDEARCRAQRLRLENLDFLHADLAEVDTELEGQFEFIVCHGVFSWIDHATRDAMLHLVARRLAPGGLLYLNYNTKPGWVVRGLIRKFLLAQTEGTEGLLARAQSARQACIRMLEGLDGDPDHPYRQLLVDELKFTGEWDLSYLAHEYLAEHNHAYWRSELLALVAKHGLTYVADADFNYPWNEDQSAKEWLVSEGLRGWSLNDTVDLVRYRQLHSPIFTTTPYRPTPISAGELAELYVASCLTPAEEGSDDGVSFLMHPSGFRVEVSNQQVRESLLRLAPRWPRGLRVGDAFPDVPLVLDDLPLLHRNRLVELGCVDPPHEPSLNALNRLEVQWGGYRTSPDHRWEPAAPTISPDEC